MNVSLRTNAGSAPELPPPPASPRSSGPEGSRRSGRAEEAASSRSPTDTTTVEGRERAAAHLSSLGEAHRPPPDGAALSRVVQGAVSAYLNDGPTALREYVSSDLATLRALANPPDEVVDSRLRAELERQGNALRDLISGLDAGSIRDIVDTTVSAFVRRGVMAQADAAVRARVRELGSLAADLPARLEALRAAVPGSEDAAIAEMLGIRGDSDDLNRARSALAESAHGLQEFANRMRGQSWAPSEFPSAAGRAARQLGLEGAWSRVAEETTPAERSDGVHLALDLAEGVHLAHEIVHGAGVLATSSTAIGIAVGLLVHHYSAQAHEAHIDLGQSLGL